MHSGETETLGEYVLVGACEAGVVVRERLGGRVGGEDDG